VHASESKPQTATPTPSPAPATDGPEKPTSGPTSVATSLFLRTSKLVGGLAGASALVFVFGFLSQRSLYKYSGLPMLQLDYSATVERGGLALLNSLSAVFDDPWRTGATATIIAAGLIFWAYYHRSAFFARVVQSPWWCTVAQLVTLLLVAGALVGLFDVSHVSNANENEVLDAALARVQAMRENGSWTPLAEAQEIGRAGYPTTGLFRPVRHTLELLEPSTPEGDLVSPRTSGFALRQFATDRLNARRVYGWIFLTTLLLAALAVVLSRWRHMLHVRTFPSRLGPATKRKVSENRRHSRRMLTGLLLAALRHLQGTRFENWYRDHQPLVATKRTLERARVSLRIEDQPLLQVSKWVIEPATALAIASALFLLPIAHGVLVESAIGEERVTVQLKPSCVGKIERSAGDNAEKTVVKEGDVQAKTKAQQQPMRLQECGKLAEKDGRALAEAVSTSVRLLFSAAQYDAEQVEKARGDYTQTIDALVEWTEQSRCAAGIRLLERLRPTSTMFLNYPAATEHYLDRFIDLQDRAGPTRSGHILAYPRGEATETIVLFESLQRRHSSSRVRWLISNVPQECVSRIVVSPEPVTASVEHMVKSAKQSDQTDSLGAAFTIHRSLLAATLDAISEAHGKPVNYGALVTNMGILGGALREYEPGLTMRAVAMLVRTILDESRHSGVRGAAATSLWRIGGPWAALALGRLLMTRPDLPVPVIGTLATAAGNLAREHGKLRISSEASSPTVGQVLSDFLVGLATSGDYSSDISAAAISAMGRGGLSEAGDAVVEWVDAHPGPISERVNGVLLKTAGTLRLERARNRLRATARNTNEAGSMRTEALRSLYEITLYGEADLVSSILLERPGVDEHGSLVAFRRRILLHVEDVDPLEMSTALVRKLERAESERERAMAAGALALIDADSKGDEGGVAASLADRLGGIGIVLRSREHSSMCRSISEFALRGGV
jgi:hypothetical protein